jgi:hypothetical protein
MPALFIQALMGALAQAMGSFIGRAVLALGVGTVTYTGIMYSIDTMRSSIISSFNGLPADAIGLLGFLWVDKCLTIIFSGVTVALSMRLIGGSIKKIVIK